MATRDVNVFTGRDGSPRFTVHTTFVVGLDDLACAAFMVGLHRKNYGRARLLRAVDDMVHQFGYSAPPAWDAATDDEVSEAYAAAERLFPEFGEDGHTQECEEDPDGGREQDGEEDEDGDLGADDDRRPVGGGGVEAPRGGGQDGG